ncbi:hypothetical protein CDAR_5451, partial [Caerostris darwini]
RERRAVKKATAKMLEEGLWKTEGVSPRIWDEGVLV